MVGPAYDWFTNPLGAVRFLFERSGSSPDSSLGDWGVRDLFAKAVLDDGALLQVPEINSVPLDAIPANSLVRFRGMVQDMFNVEYYIGAYKAGDTWKTNKYTDAATMPTCNESDMKIWDRRPLYCVPAPGENAWVKDLFAAPYANNNFKLSGDMQKNQKRLREDASASSDEMLTEVEDRSVAEEKRVCRETMPDDDDGRVTSARAPVDLNMPMSEKSLVPCLVKVYDGVDGDLKLNDIAEFIGVLTYDPDLSSHSANTGELSDVQAAFMEEDAPAHLPASQVPRLHCIFYRKLSDRMLFSAISGSVPHGYDFGLDVTGLRRSLVNLFTEVLGGDELAAEYLLLHLLSHVHARVEPMAVGKLSLNIMDSTNTSDAAASSMLANRISQAITALLPRSHLMSLSLDYLNRKSVSPRKDYSNNRLMTGDLQLADGTHLMLNETEMKPGHLTEVGLQNVHYIKNLMEWQKVEYDFQFYKMEMPADVPVLVFSTAKSRLFPADVAVPLRSTRSSSLVLPVDLLSKWRMYISQARQADHSICPSVQKVLEDDLVSARQEDRTLGTDVFHRWLTLARLMSISYGESTLTVERWQTVKDVERKLAERIRAC